jgi:hypothetical protein
LLRSTISQKYCTLLAAMLMTGDYTFPRLDQIISIWWYSLTPYIKNDVVAAFMVSSYSPSILAHSLHTSNASGADLPSGLDKRFNCLGSIGFVND